MKERYADIIVDITHEKLDRPFQYRIPEKFRDVLEIGMRVLVPFGNGNKLTEGYCVGISETCSFNPTRMKDIQGLVQKGVSVEDKLMELAKWIRRNYGSTMIQALKTVLPVKQTAKQLEHRTICAAMTREELISLLGEAERKKNQVARARLLREMISQERVPYELVTSKLNVSASTINSLVKTGAIRVESSPDYRNPVKLTDREEKRAVLSPEQEKIVRDFLRDYDGGIRACYLIHGITGSGKTEVYMRLIEEVVNRGKQAIVLIPEIALTYQTLLRFYRRFGDRVSVMNSTLSPGEKYDQCERARRGEIDVIIGPRSALFTPFPNIGIIVMDEEHESSYKSEGTPKYHARETALEVARIHGASVVLGSATPSLEAYFRAKQGDYKLFRLDESLTVEQDTDLTVTFYLTETILQAEQVQVNILQQGLVTEEICRQVAQAAAEGVREELDGHASGSGAHSALFAQKAPLSHTHSPGQITAGTFGGMVTAQSNTSYETAQVRNISLSPEEPSGGNNGQLWFKYTT